jgi:UPF0148 protein
MSDTDDGFDEEAVRAELREKYADEEDERAATARMSELLLQGATMTNQHCDRCGNPIFRYEGQAFCPQCQAPGQQGAQQGAQQAAQQTEPGSGQPADQQSADQQSADQQSADQQSADQQSADQQSPDRRPADQQANSRGSEPPARQDVDRATRQGGEPALADARRPADRSDSAPERAGSAQPRRESDADLPAPQPGGESVDALESSIAALARRGASADDPRTAREYLEAAREAAEALAALRRHA